jgi:hypothetical protein
MTWVLVIILFSADGVHPFGITSVPGYTASKDCDNAREEVGRKFRPRGYLVQTDCIPGPTK